MERGWTGLGLPAYRDVEPVTAPRHEPVITAKEETERGWTGLGLPAYQEPSAAPAPSAVEPAPSAVEAAPAPAPSAAESAPSAVEAAPARAPSAVEAAPSAVEAAPAPAPSAVEAAPAPAPNVVEPAPKAVPRRDVGAAAVKSTSSTLRAQSGPPRPTGKSGAFAAVRPLGAVGDAAQERPSAPDGEGAPRVSATPQEPALGRVSATPPEPISRASTPGPPPRPSAPARVSRPDAAPPRPTGRSGAFPAVQPPAPPPAPAGDPSLVPAPAGDPSLVPAPPRDPSPVPREPTPPPAVPREPPPAAVGPRAPTPPPAAAGPRAPTPSPAAARELFPPDETETERDITFEDEGDLGATIPDVPPQYADLTATVPNLPPPVHTPSFGLPPLAAAPPPAFGDPHAPRHAAPPPPMGAATASPIAAPAGSPQGLAGDGTDAETGPPPYGPGAIIGDKYRLIRVIGRGGMGAVWIAHNIALDVEVAIKLMRRDRATPEAAARFTTEARAAARLGHPSIVRVFDFGETSRGDPFIVMELLHGESFGALLQRKKKLSATVAVQTLLPVAHALAAAHGKGIVHRDLKPDNILLAKDETGVVNPKLVDFGIAKLVTTDVDRHFTIAGEVLGSPDYMSPEQARGEDDIDARSDIWTFSVLLYEAIVGRRPFEGSNYNALLAAIIATRPVPMMEAGVNEPALWSILEKGLSKERDGRWQSVREMGMELARWAIDHGAETDLVGTSLSAQWLEPTRKRLFTVAGSQPSEASSSDPGQNPKIPKPPPLGGLAGEVPKPAAPAISNTMPPSSL